MLQSWQLPQERSRDEWLQVPLALKDNKGGKEPSPCIAQEPTAELELDPEPSAPCSSHVLGCVWLMGACKGLLGQRGLLGLAPKPPPSMAMSPHAHPWPTLETSLGAPLPHGLGFYLEPLKSPSGWAASHPLHTLRPAFPFPMVSARAGLQLPPCALPLFQFYELFLAINTCLRAHLSGPAALESACRAAHDRSKLTRMILELLLIPSAPRNAPSSMTWCQAGQPPSRLQQPHASSSLLPGSSLCLRMGWDPSIPPS